MEFGGYAGPSRVVAAMSSRVVSHLETAFVISGKGYATDLRERRFIDLPGSNRSRGWSGCSLKEEHEQIRVPYKLKKELEAPKESVLKKDVLSSEDPQVGHEDSALTTVADDEPSWLWNWGHSEKFFRELFFAFGTPNTVRVVSCTPSSAAMMAAARDRFRYLGFARTAKVKQILLEDAFLQVTLAMVRGSGDFGFMRVLTREESLGGTEAGQGDQVMAAAAAAAAAPAAGAAGEGGEDNGQARGEGEEEGAEERGGALDGDDFVDPEA